MQIRFTRIARADLRRIRAWFRQPGAGIAADRRLARLEASIERLADTPFAFPAGPGPETRLLVSQHHRVVYRILPNDGAVLIVRIYGPGQSSP